MSIASNAAESTANRDELAKGEGNQGAESHLWWYQRNEANIEFLEHSCFASKPQLNIDEYCMTCPAFTESPGSHHASFGDNGTTATVSRYGDIMQVTQYLGNGSSGIFSMDHTSTREPCLVSDRASDLEDLSQTSYGSYTYGLFMNGWPSKDPKTVKWVNWRWPRYEWETDNLKTVFQYYVHQGIVLHQLLFHNTESDGPEDRDLEQNPSLSGEIRVQDADYLSFNTQDNDKGREDGSPEPEHTGPCGYGRVQTNSNRDVVAVIDVFVDGRRTKIPQGQNLPPLEPLGKGCTREIVVAYRLSLLPHQPGVTWQDLIIPASKADVGKFLREETERFGSKCLDPKVLDLPLIGSMAQDTAQTDATDHDAKSAQGRLEKVGNQLRMVQYLTARHLEHILSVCAVPVPKLHNQPSSPAPVALTCGDMSGHRICTSASYYAFLFLIETERRLADVKKLPHMEDNGAAHIDSLRERIRKTCQGHIMWLKNIWRNTNPEPFTSGRFAANYWVTGEMQDDGDSDTWQPPSSVTDTAFQILKITGYANTYGDDALKSVQPLLTKVFVAWLHDLDRLDPREKYAWPRPKQDGVDTFRLEDHFWVWRALKALEDQNMWSELPKPKRSTPNAEKRDTKEDRDRWKVFEERVDCRLLDDSGDLSPLYDTGKFFLIARRLVPREVQRAVLQRFTTVNDISGVRALAVNRSSRETRFLLHDRDSALLYDQEGLGSFFPDDSFKTLWKQTLNFQPYHPANEESAVGSKWYTVMRYALSIMMGARGSTLNSVQASQALSGSFKTLLNFFSHNAFLGEQLSWLTKEPVIFDDDRSRDSHFHASFEVMWVLLTHAKYVQPELEHKAKSKNPVGKYEETEIEMKEDSEKSVPESDRLTEMLRKLEDVSIALNALPKGLATTQRQMAPIPMEERMPFNNHVVSSNVCPIEEEWLYNYPQFFSDLGGGLKRLSSSDEKSRSHDDEPSGNDKPSVNDKPSGKDKEINAIVIDAKKHKQYGKPRKHNKLAQTDFRIDLLSYEGLRGKLGTPRIARDAKKRFIWLPNAKDVAHQISLAARDSEAEKQAVSLFFNRHFQCEKLVQDDTSLALNSWNSELHLSFQCLVDQDHPAAPDRNSQCPSDNSNQVDCVLNATHATFPQPKDMKGKILCRASMSYRFNGDLFDHYWTCHFVESSHTQQSEQFSTSSNFPTLSSLPSTPSSCQSPSSPRPSPPDNTYTCSSSTQTSSECGKCDPCLFLSKDGRKSLFDVLNKDKQGYKTWWQRKVLELLLLQRMLEKVFQNTGSILKDIEKSQLDEKDEKRLPHWELEMTRNSWLQLVDTLETIENDLTSTLETLRTWDDRAKNHGVEKPRWTLNDENKYRGSIRKEQTSTNKLRSRIEKQKQTAVRLQKRFTEAARRLQTRWKEEQKAKSEREEKKRAAREQQSERNIRWFTYVTIVFAPLSFAEGFYSMGGAPPYELTRSLVTFSAVALLITVVLLFGAIKTFSALKKKREFMESGSDGRSRKISPVSKEKDESKESGSDGKSLPSLWMLLLSTVLDHMARVMVYPTRVWEQQDGTRPARVLISLVVGFALGIIMSPVFIILWFIQFSLLNVRDLYCWLKHQLYVPPRKESEPRNAEEARSPRCQLGHSAIQPPRLLERYLKK